MKIDVKMPQMGESLTEGTILKWWKKPGDPVKKDETLLEISTDKVDSEIPSPADGILSEVLVSENETVEVGTVIARIENPAETSGQPKEQSAPPAGDAETVARAVQKEAEEKTADEAASGQSEIRLVEIKMPQLGESLTEGTIVKWWKQVGDPVEKDETLLEISTDKVDSEVPSPVKGVLQEILVAENETVPIDTVIARVAVPGEIPDQPVGEAPEKAPSAAPTHQKEPLTETKPAKTPFVRQAGGRFYSPLVLTIARREGVSREELERIPGSGAGGRVTKKDILNYLQNRPTAPRRGQPGTMPEVRGTVAGERIEVVPLNNIQKKMAQHMRQSLDTSAHVYSVSECDMTRVLNIMANRRPAFLQEEGFKLTVTPFLLYVVVQVLKEFPLLNASLEGENIVYHRDIHLGIAVAGPKGLIVPVIKNAEEKSFRGLARAVNDLVTRTRENKLTLDDIQGSTFSVTNYGVFGNIIGLPIINQPNVAILGIGAIKKRPVVIEAPEGDAIAIRSLAYLSLSYDHRIIDGETGGRFLQKVVGYLEDFKEETL